MKYTRYRVTLTYDVEVLDQLPSRAVAREIEATLREIQKREYSSPVRVRHSPICEMLGQWEPSYRDVSTVLIYPAADRTVPDPTPESEKSPALLGGTPPPDSGKSWSRVCTDICIPGEHSHPYPGGVYDRKLDRWRAPDSQEEKPS